MWIIRVRWSSFTRTLQCSFSLKDTIEFTTKFRIEHHNYILQGKRKQPGAAAAAGFDFNNTVPHHHFNIFYHQFFATRYQRFSFNIFCVMVNLCKKDQILLIVSLPYSLCYTLMMSLVSKLCPEIDDSFVLPSENTK